MNLVKLGFDARLKAICEQDEYSDFTIGRVVVEHKERYVVQTEDGSITAEITGNLRYASIDNTDFPAVGDWVGLSVIDSSLAIIVKVLPRQGVLKRQAIATTSGQQIIATNLNSAFIVQAMGHDFNLNRLERYLSICHSAAIEPIIVINKIDLYTKEEITALENSIKARIKDTRVLFISNETMHGFDQLYPLLIQGKTFGVLGSSGVGKSTLINKLSQQELMEIKSVSSSNKKGKHTTSHRELFVLENGGIIIDTPGMRELGLANDSDTLALTFDDIEELSYHCKYADCSHSNEKGCAIIDALNQGELDEAQWQNYLKLQHEQERYTSSVHEKREKDKQLGKLYKSIQSQKNKNR